MSKYLLVFFVFTIGCRTKENQVQEKPNILYIYTDQQHANMMHAAGNKWLKTPAMDYIANNGIRFTRAYCTNPVCSPSRISLMTGRFAGTFLDTKGDVVKENHGAMDIPEVSSEIRNSTIAAFLKKADYKLLFGGKQHVPPSLTAEALGFKNMSNDERFELANTAAKTIKKKHEQPWFMVVSLVNPHDICYMAIREKATSKFDAKVLEKGVHELSVLDEALKMPDGISEEDFFASYCPPLPANYEPQFEEPAALRNLIDSRPMRKNARDNFTDKQWRRHRWAYCRLVERVDQQIQIILTALQESGNEKNTLVMFSSDHGDMDGSHRMEHKSTFYEESANIPFTAMWKGHIPAGQVNTTHLISNGLDLLPTLCDYAQVEGVSDPRGRSLRPLFEGKDLAWRTTLGVESEVGNMIVHQDGLKYIRYKNKGEVEEQLLDLSKDPGETTHFTNNPEYRERLSMLRNELETQWFPKNFN